MQRQARAGDRGGWRLLGALLAAAAAACSVQAEPPGHAAPPAHGERGAADPADERGAAATEPPVDAGAEGSAGPADEPPTRKSALELTFVGDVIFGRYRDAGYDPIPKPEGYDSFADISAQLQADVIVANLETPVIEEVPQKSPIGSQYRFGASRKHLALLANQGRVVVSLANNHYFDLRQQGQRETPRIARELGMFPIGASRDEPPLFRVETLEVEGWRLGFVALTTRRNAPQFPDAPLLPFTSLREIPGELEPLLRGARAEHDLLIVVVHWGEEYAEAPDVYTRKVAHRLIDAGADLVIGHHPHVLQAIEQYGGGVIAYSLGNFLFENATPIPRLTGVLRIRYEGSAPCRARVVFHPAYIARTPSKHPAPATGAIGRQVRDRVIAQARAFDTVWERAPEGEDVVMVDPRGCSAVAP